MAVIFSVDFVYLWEDHYIYWLRGEIDGSTVQLLEVLLKVTQYCYGEDGRLFMIYCWHLYNWYYINIKYLLSDSIYVNSLQMIIFFQLQWTCSRNINQK